MNAIASLPSVDRADTTLSRYHLLDPEVLANPYPLYHRLRTEAPVHWDPFLHAWVVTRYPDVVRVLHDFSADRTPSPEQLERMNLSAISPIAAVMVKQMLFLDALLTRACAHLHPAPSHPRGSGYCNRTFSRSRTL